MVPLTCEAQTVGERVNKDSNITTLQCEWFRLCFTVAEVDLLDTPSSTYANVGVPSLAWRMSCNTMAEAGRVGGQVNHLICSGHLVISVWGCSRRGLAVMTCRVDTGLEPVSLSGYIRWPFWRPLQCI